MLGIDPNIEEHEINIYDNGKPVREMLRPANPKKLISIKANVEK
jgi:hypothetical protein